MKDHNNDGLCDRCGAPIQYGEVTEHYADDVHRQEAVLAEQVDEEFYEKEYEPLPARKEVPRTSSGWNLKKMLLFIGMTVPIIMVSFVLFPSFPMPPTTIYNNNVLVNVQGFVYDDEAHSALDNVLVYIYHDDEFIEASTSHGGGMFQLAMMYQVNTKIRVESTHSGYLDYSQEFTIPYAAESGDTVSLGVVYLQPVPIPSQLQLHHEAIWATTDFIVDYEYGWIGIAVWAEANYTMQFIANNTLIATEKVTFHHYEMFSYDLFQTPFNETGLIEVWLVFDGMATTFGFYNDMRWWNG